MSKKVFVVSSTFRKNGNSEILANEFARGAKDAGHEVEILYLRDITMGFCKGCLACAKTGTCVIKDDMTPLVEKVAEADVLCFATPVYYYSLSGQLKTFLDRVNPLYGRNIGPKDVYFMASALDHDPAAVDTPIKDMEGWAGCFDGVELKGVVKALQTDETGDVLKFPDVLAQAYAYGKNLL